MEIILSALQLFQVTLPKVNLAFFSTSCLYNIRKISCKSHFNRCLTCVTFLPSTDFLIMCHLRKVLFLNPSLLQCMLVTGLELPWEVKFLFVELVSGFFHI